MFDAKDRQIFRYFNGIREVFGDPVALQRAYARELKGEDIDLLQQHVQCNVEELSGPAYEKFLDAARATFGVKPLDPETGEGLTESETMDTLGRFLAYIVELKKKAETSPNSSASTEAGFSAPSLTPKRSSGSGSTGRGSRPKKPSK